MNRQYGPWPPKHARVKRRLDATERRVEQLQNALNALARETNGIRVSHPCTECERCLLFVERGTMYCPRCGYRRTR